MDRNRLIFPEKRRRPLQLQRADVAEVDCTSPTCSAYSDDEIQTLCYSPENEEQAMRFCELLALALRADGTPSLRSQDMCEEVERRSDVDSHSSLETGSEPELIGLCDEEDELSDERFSPSSLEEPLHGALVRNHAVLEKDIRRLRGVAADDDGRLSPQADEGDEFCMRHHSVIDPQLVMFVNDLWTRGHSEAKQFVDRGLEDTDRASGDALNENAERSGNSASTEAHINENSTQEHATIMEQLREIVYSKYAAERSPDKPAASSISALSADEQDLSKYRSALRHAGVGAPRSQITPGKRDPPIEEASAVSAVVLATACDADGSSREGSSGEHDATSRMQPNTPGANVPTSAKVSCTDTHSTQDQNHSTPAEPAITSSPGASDACSVPCLNPIPELLQAISTHDATMVSDTAARSTEDPADIVLLSHLKTESREGLDVEEAAASESNDTERRLDEDWNRHQQSERPAELLTIKEALEAIRDASETLPVETGDRSPHESDPNESTMSQAYKSKLRRRSQKAPSNVAQLTKGPATLMLCYGVKVNLQKKVTVGGPKRVEAIEIDSERSALEALGVLRLPHNSPKPDLLEVENRFCVARAATGLAAIHNYERPDVPLGSCDRKIKLILAVCHAYRLRFPYLFFGLATGLESESDIQAYIEAAAYSGIFVSWRNDQLRMLRHFRELVPPAHGRAQQCEAFLVLAAYLRASNAPSAQQPLVMKNLTLGLLSWDEVNGTLGALCPAVRASTDALAEFNRSRKMNIHSQNIVYCTLFAGVRLLEAGARSQTLTVEEVFDVAVNIGAPGPVSPTTFFKGISRLYDRGLKDRYRMLREFSAQQGLSSSQLFELLHFKRTPFELKPRRSYDLSPEHVKRAGFGKWINAGRSRQSSVVASLKTHDPNDGDNH